MGNNTITFGAFEKHPEYKAKLYLAALQTGMKMKNQPSLDELRAYPEFTQIQSIIKQKSLKKNPVRPGKISRNCVSGLKNTTPNWSRLMPQQTKIPTIVP